MRADGHFPWQRLVTCLIADASILWVGYIYKGWLYFFATLDPHTTSGASAITALSAFCGVMIMGIVAIQIFFITGSTRSLEAMFKFNAASMAASTLQSATERVDEEIVERTPRPRDFEDHDESQLP